MPNRKRSKRKTYNEIQLKFPPDPGQSGKMWCCSVKSQKNYLILKYYQNWEKNTQDVPGMCRYVGMIDRDRAINKLLFVDKRMTQFMDRLKG